MPELAEPKNKPVIHPPSSRVVSAVGYAELHVTSNFSFLRGASHPEELVMQAAELGYRAVAVTDINSLAGIVRGHAAAKEAGISFIVGCHVQVKAAIGVLAKGSPYQTSLLSVLMYPTDRASYGRLCRLLTFGKRQAEKGKCELTLQDVIDHQEGNLAILLPPQAPDEQFIEMANALKTAFAGDRLSLAASCCYDAGEETHLKAVFALSKQLGIPAVATNDVHYHVLERKSLQDVVTCIRMGCTLAQAGFALHANAERHMKTPDEMARLFVKHPEAIARTVQIAARASSFSLKQLKYEYPSEVCPPGKTMMEHLIQLTWQGAAERYRDGVPESVRERILHEFDLIRDLNYPAYFLTVEDIVRFARSLGILCQGRGAAANSAVCYCLGVTAVDPARIDLLVERFISKERDEPPDIDIDFEHERREEVIQYIYQKYGRERAALTAEVITYRRRSAIREVGKALGLSLDCVDQLAKSGDWWDKGIVADKRLRELGLNPRDRTIRTAISLASELCGFPRHLSQHVGGFVITQGPLCEMVPIENAAMPDRTVIEWDKDDINELGMLKVDILALGMLTAIRKTIDLVNGWDKATGGNGELQFHTVPAEDPAVYDMLCRADSVGVFQVESRAQMTMLPRLKPRCFYDLVIEVAIVRPGPIQGNMVHPYLRRRDGTEPVVYPNEDIQAVLGKTLGVPLFQEQAMRLVMVAAGFTAGEADGLRRAMAAWKRKGHMFESYGKKIISGMLARNYTHAYALRCVEQLKGFSEYGFPESHAASFALLVYVSAWLKKHHPAAFAAGLVNSQPMGFYQPAQLVRDAQEHGVKVLPVDVNRSKWDCTLEPSHDSTRLTSPALRLGMRLTKRLRAADAQKIVAAVERNGPFPSVHALWRVTSARVGTLRALAEADAFGSMCLTRQTSLWAIRQLRDDGLPLFDSLEPDEKPTSLPKMMPSRLVVFDYASIGLSLKAHPVSFLRPRLDAIRVTPTGRLKDERRYPQNSAIAVAGLVLVRQRPATASGVVFITLEDETGVANLIIRPNVYERCRKAIRHSTGIIAWGHVERQGLVVHVVVERVENVRERVSDDAHVAVASRDFH
jgi:error-prone DNA polymerase